MVPETFDTKLTDSNKIRNKFFLNDFFRQNFENLNDDGELDGDERDGIACRRKRKTFWGRNIKERQDRNDLHLFRFRLEVERRNRFIVEFIGRRSSYFENVLFDPNFFWSVQFGFTSAVDSKTRSRVLGRDRWLGTERKLCQKGIWNLLLPLLGIIYTSLNFFRCRKLKNCF